MPTITDSRLAQMRRMREKNKTLAQIGDRFGITRQRVQQLIGDAVPREEAHARRRALREEQLERLWPKALADFRTGKGSVTEIQERYGISRREFAELSKRDPLAFRSHQASAGYGRSSLSASDLRGLKRIAKSLGSTPSIAKYEALRRPTDLSAQTLTKRGGSWNRVCAQAGLTPNQRPARAAMGQAMYTEDDYLDRMIAMYERLGHWPTITEWVGSPSVGSYRKRFGGWLRAINAAQERLEIRKQGDPS